METEISNKNELWAAAINKILQTDVPKKKTTVLALAEKEEVTKKEDKVKEFDFEVDGAENEIKEEKPDVNDIDIKPKLGAQRLIKKEHFKVGHVKPDILEKNYEKTLMKIATKGVVQLFNAVRQQQNVIEKTLKTTKRKIVDTDDVAQSIDKDEFYNKLSEKIKSVPVSLPQPVKIKKEEPEPAWSVLRDDFLTNSSVKNWD